MENLADLTPEQLEAILGTDYETVIADALRRKEAAEGSPDPQRAMGQIGNGHVFFDPGYAIEKYVNRRRMAKDREMAQGDLDKALGEQKAGRRAYAQALVGKPAPVPTAAPRTVDSTLPAPTPAPAMNMAPGAPQAPMALGGPKGPPALQNAMGLPQDRLAKAGVPADVQALIAKLRGQ